jgi:hypothetical protein
MYDTNIIVLIDAYLDRLLEARDILATLEIPQTMAQIPTTSFKPRKKQSIKPTKTLTTPDLDEKMTTSPLKSRILTEKRAAERLNIAVSKSRQKSLNPIPSAIVSTGRDRSSVPQQSEVLKATPPRKAQPSQKRQTSSSPLSAKALGGHIPTGPVFIPAEKIHTTKVREISGPLKSTPLTAELLSQRWIQG